MADFNSERSAFTWLAAPNRMQDDVDQLKVIREQLDKRIQMAQSYVTLHAFTQGQMVLLATWDYLGDVGDMCRRKRIG